jgi:branched-subunit amino acid ABC-type transport system permease component
MGINWQLVMGVVFIMGVAVGVIAGILLVYSVLTDRDYVEKQTRNHDWF